MQDYVLLPPRLRLRTVQRKDRGNWPEWSNPIRVNNHHSRISSLYMLKVGGVFECRVVPVQVSQPGVNRRVAMADVSLIALEETIIGDIKADYCDVQTDIRLSKSIADQEGGAARALSRYNLFNSIEGRKYPVICLLVG